jgi:hypothetical protein
MKRFSKFIQESVKLDEKLKASDDMGDWVTDFQDSDAPQFKGKSQKKRQQMAIAAKLNAEREAGMRKEAVKIDEARKSDSYKFTHKPGDAESEKRLADLKQSVKGTGKRVVLQGRLGKDNPNAHKYSKDAPSAKYKDGKRVNSDVSGKSGGHSHQRIQKADAAHHDVYVYDRRESVDVDEATVHRDFTDKTTPMGNRKAYAAAKANDEKKLVSLKKAPWDMKKEEAEKQLFMDPADKMWKVSYDHGPHQSNTIKVKAKSQSHAWEVAKEVAKKKYGHARITSGGVTQAKEEVDLDEGKNLTDTKSDWRSDKSATAKNWSHNKLMKAAKHDRSVEKEIKRRIASKEYVFSKEEVELDEASDLRITKVYNKFPKKATYAVHSPDRKYYKEFDSMEKAKAHHADKTGK